MCEPKHKMWVLHLSHATAVKSLKCLLLSLRAEKQRCHIKSFRAWLDQYKQTHVSLFKPVPWVAPQTKLTLALTVWREPSQIPLTLGLRGSPWLRLRAAVVGRFHPHWQLGSSKLEPPQLRRELYYATREEAWYRQQSDKVKQFLFCQQRRDSTVSQRRQQCPGLR